jgi:membrane-associated phospholipid phosphatase
MRPGFERRSGAESDAGSWVERLTRRMRRHFLLKLVGTTVFVCLFFVGYLHVLHHPAFAVTVMPLTALDALIVFQPQALFAYLSLWLYLGMGPGLQLTFLELVAYAAWLCALCLVGLSIFYWWPTQVPALPFDVSVHPGFEMLKGIDAAGNACPSLHVAVAAFTLIRVRAVLRRIGAPLALELCNAAWFAAIAWSTLATKQHVVLDVVAGALLGLAFAYPSLRWQPASARRSRGAAGRAPAAARLARAPEP